MNCHMSEQEPKVSGSLEMNMYDLNKQLMAQFPSLDAEQMRDACETITDLADDTMNRYYMLLCREVNYYTIFDVDHGSNNEHFGEVVLECATDLGAIKAVDRIEGAIEIWTHNAESEPMAMYLFPYDAGVIKCTI